MRTSQPSVMQGRFARSPMPKVQRSKFNMSHGLKTTMDAGYLYPIMCEEILPGDTWSLQMTAFSRFATLQVPIMDNVHFDVHYFFVPTRLIWTNWERFNGARDLPDSSIDYVIPTVKNAAELDETLTVADRSLADYFGLPIGTILQEHRPSALPFRAYNFIYNEWYRSQSLQDKLQLPLGDGPDSISWYTLQRRGKHHDYFTQMLPWPQKGDPVSLVIADLADAAVVGNGDTLGFTNGTDNVGLQQSNAGVTLSASLEAYGTARGTAVGVNPPTTSATLGLTTSSADSGLTALTSALDPISITLQDLRTAAAYQQLLEADARGGTRYTEIIHSRYGVSPMDARLQRPEFLGGGSVPTQISSVAQTTPSPATPTVNDAQARLSAYGQNLSFTGFHRSFEEHGYIIGLANIRADITYQQGMRKLWSRQTRYDFYDPILANLGEQTVLNKEFWYYPDLLTADDVMGYIPRWDEYRFIPSRVTGAMRSTDATSLDVYHLALDFTELPLLNADWIRDNPPIARVVSVPSQPHFIVDMYFKCTAVRPLPIFGIPGLRRL